MVVPLIISSDKTQVTSFRNKAAYLVYLTIGNIPKSIWRKPSQGAQILLAYLPTTKLEHIPSKAARRRAMNNLSHSCMGRIFKPLRSIGVDGILMSTGAGVAHRTHPIFACFSGDYPEQVLATCTKTGECRECDVPHDDLGADAIDIHFRDIGKILAAHALADTNPIQFVHACVDAGVKPTYHPFWTLLPYLNIFRSITPDVLHRLLQGILKHIVAWVKSAFGPAELDARCRRLPPNHNVRLFLNGISNLSRLTGKEHDEISRILLGILIDLPLPNGRNSDRLIHAVRAVLDFLYISQYPVHTTESLAALDDALSAFHANKDIFIELAIRQSFNIPKLHSLRHYSGSIKLFGTTDNYNTQAMEHLHIDYAKEAYRATNRKEEYPQMTIWLERKEKVARHASYIAWALAADHHVESLQQTTTLVLSRSIKMPKHPSISSVSLELLVNDYRATYLREALAWYIVATNHPDWMAWQVEEAALDTFLHFGKLPVFHKVKFISTTDQETCIIDSIHANGPRKKKQGRYTVPGRFDTALACVGECGEIGVQGNLLNHHLWC